MKGPRFFSFSVYWSYTKDGESKYYFCISKPAGARCRVSILGYSFYIGRNK